MTDRRQSVNDAADALLVKLGALGQQPRGVLVVACFDGDTISSVSVDDDRSMAEKLSTLQSLLTALPQIAKHAINGFKARAAAKGDG